MQLKHERVELKGAAPSAYRLLGVVVVVEVVAKAAAYPNAKAVINIFFI